MRRIVLILILILTGDLLAQGQALTLNECIQLAIQKHPLLHQRQLELESAQQGLKLAASARLPQIGISTAYQQSTQGKNEVLTKARSDNSYSISWDVRQNIYNGGIVRNRIKLAQNTYRQLSQQTSITRQQLIAEVTEKFYTFFKHQELLKVYQLAAQNSQEQLKKTDEMYRLGKVAKKDLYKAQVREGNDRLNVVRQEAQVKLALDDLKKSIGVPAEYPLTVQEEVYQLPQLMSREEAIKRALENNPNLQVLHLGQESARLNYQIARGDLKPVVNASFGYSRGGSEFNRLYTPFDKWWNTALTVNLSYPLFQGFYRKANIQQKYLEYQTYDDQIQQQRLELINRVDNLLTTLRTYTEMIAINELNIASAEEDLRLQQEMYRLNSATLLEVLDAQVALTRAQGELISIKYDAKIAEVQLALLLGTL